MKKVISILLALLMLFSTATVAFAAEGDATDTPVVEDTNNSEDVNDGTEDGEASSVPSADELMSMIEGMNWTEIKAALKIAKIAVKLALVLDKLGFIDLSPIKNAILEFAWGMIKDLVEQNKAESETPDETVTEAPAGDEVTEPAA